MRRGRVEFGTVRIRHAADIACEFNHGTLHAEADSEERNIVFARITDRLDLSGNAAVSESARHQNAVVSPEQFVRITGIEFFGFNRMNLYLDVIRDSSVGKRLVDTLVGIAQGDIFSHDRNRYDAVRRIEHRSEHCLQDQAALRKSSS